jgi:hypothetical protein
MEANLAAGRDKDPGAVRLLRAIKDKPKTEGEDHSE